MTNNFYPIFINGNQLSCLIVGGGKVAERKVETLAENGATITVVSPQITPLIASAVTAGKATWIESRYDKQFIKDVQLVIGATDSPAVNEQIYLDAKRLNILVNIVDDPDHCTFIVPSVLCKGPLKIAVSTGGAAPKLAGKIRRDIERKIPDEYTVMIEELHELRPRIKQLPADQKNLFWQTIATLNVSDYTGQADNLRRWINQLLDQSGSTINQPVFRPKG